MLESAVPRNLAKPKCLSRKLCFIVACVTPLPSLPQNSVEGEMQEHLDALHAARDHAGAADLYKRMKALRAEVEALQREQEAAAQASQRSSLAAGARMMTAKLRAIHAAHAQEVGRRLHAREQDLLAKHAIERETLEADLAREQPPPVHHSKRYFELLNTEKQLAKGHAYRDASWVKRSVDALEQPELVASQAAYHRGREERRRRLAADHASELDALRQRNLGLDWQDVRARERQARINAKRFSHHAVDMAHVHGQEARQRPELNYPASMLRFKRAGYAATSAGLRGGQLKGAAERGGVSAHDPRMRWCASTLGFLGTDVPDYLPPPAARPHGPDLPGIGRGHDFHRPYLSTATTEWVTAGDLRRNAAAARSSSRSLSRPGTPGQAVSSAQ